MVDLGVVIESTRPVASLVTRGLEAEHSDILQAHLAADASAEGRAAEVRSKDDGVRHVNAGHCVLDRYDDGDVDDGWRVAR